MRYIRSWVWVHSLLAHPTQVKPDRIVHACLQVQMILANLSSRIPYQRAVLLTNFRNLSCIPRSGTLSTTMRSLKTTTSHQRAPPALPLLLPLPLPNSLLRQQQRHQYPLPPRMMTGRHRYRRIPARPVSSAKAALIALLQAVTPARTRSRSARPDARTARIVHTADTQTQTDSCKPRCDAISTTRMRRRLGCADLPGARHVPVTSPSRPRHTPRHAPSPH
jgi:hypothetical protein